MPERVPIPPKGQTAVEIEIVPAPHGADVVIRLRSLTLAPKLQRERRPGNAMVMAWRALGDELEHRGVNLYRLLSAGLTRRGEEDLSDG